MPEYTCIECDFSTKIKTHYNRHLATKKHQKKIEKSINGGPPKDPQSSIKNIEICPSVSIKEYICEYCDAIFTNSSHLSRHKRRSCKSKMEQEKQQKELDELKLIIKQEREKHQQERDSLHKHINELIKKAGNTTNNTANITLNCYGQEDLSHITDDLKMELIKLPYGMVQKMIEHVHFSNKRPENWNIKLTNKKDKLIKVYRGKKWKYADKDEVVSELIQTNYCRLDDFYENVASNDLTEPLNCRYKKFQEKFDGDDEELKDKLMKESEMVLLSENLKQNKI